MVEGACLCGAVRYEFTTPLKRMEHCHCSMCRKHHGTAFATFVSSPLDEFRWLAGQDNVRAYDSSPRTKRFFCGTCGSVTPLLLEDEGVAFAPAGNLATDPGIRPELHMFVGSKAPWYTISDSLPQFDAFPPACEARAVERPKVEPQDGLVLGSCLCGDVAFAIEGRPTAMWNCHCSRCRRARSAAHATNAFMPKEQFRWLRGEGQIAQYKLPEAARFTAAFCRRCGSAAPRFSPELSLTIVPAGAFDTDPGIVPTAHIFVASKAPWFEIRDKMPQFPEGPPKR